MLRGMYPEFWNNLDQHKNVIKMPQVVFHGFHPDYIVLDSHTQPGRHADNSKIITYSYFCGLTQQETASLFNRELSS
jgi:hypothetical protein